MKTIKNDIWEQLKIDSGTDSEGERSFEGEYFFKDEVYFLTGDFSVSIGDEYEFEVTILEAINLRKDETVTDSDLIESIENHITTIN